MNANVEVIDLLDDSSSESEAEPEPEVKKATKEKAKVGGKTEEGRKVRCETETTEQRKQNSKIENTEESGSHREQKLVEEIRRKERTKEVFSYRMPKLFDNKVEDEKKISTSSNIMQTAVNVSRTDSGLPDKKRRQKPVQFQSQTNLEGISANTQKKIRSDKYETIANKATVPPVATSNRKVTPPCSCSEATEDSSSETSIQKYVGIKLKPPPSLPPPPRASLVKRPRHSIPATEITQQRQAIINTISPPLLPTDSSLGKKIETFGELLRGKLFQSIEASICGTSIAQLQHIQPNDPTVKDILEHATIQVLEQYLGESPTIRVIWENNVASASLPPKSMDAFSFEDQLKDCLTKNLELTEADFGNYGIGYLPKTVAPQLKKIAKKVIEEAFNYFNNISSEAGPEDGVTADSICKKDKASAMAHLANNMVAPQKEDSEDDDARAEEPLDKEEADYLRDTSSGKRVVPRWRRELKPSGSENQNGPPINEEEFGFCCAKCKCSADRKRPDHEHIEDHDGMLHRPCCHRVDYRKGVELYTEIVKAIDQAKRQAMPAARNGKIFGVKANHLEKKKKERLQQEPITRKQLEGQSYAAHNNEQQMFNSERFPSPASVAWTHPKYPFNCKALASLKNKVAKNGKRGIVVIDCFAGIGTLLVALKRLGIRIQKYIYVDHDPVAKHVSFFLKQHQISLSIFSYGSVLLWSFPGIPL